MNETIPYLPGLSPVAGKELCARFDGGRLSSDGGVLLFPVIERRLLTGDCRPAGLLHDRRTCYPASTTHSYADMIRARMFAIACGYEDCDDLVMHCVSIRRSSWPAGACPRPATT